MRSVEILVNKNLCKEPMKNLPRVFSQRPKFYCNYICQTSPRKKQLPLFSLLAMKTYSSKMFRRIDRHFDVTLVSPTFFEDFISYNFNDNYEMNCVVNYIYVHYLQCFLIYINDWLTSRSVRLRKYRHRELERSKTYCSRQAPFVSRQSCL